MIWFIIILSSLLILSVILFLIYLYRISEVNDLWNLSIPDAKISLDIYQNNEFNIPKIIKMLAIPQGAKLYSQVINNNEDIYLERYGDTYVRVRVMKSGDNSLNIKFRDFDKFGIDIKDTKTRRVPRNCQLFLVPRASRYSWYCITNYVSTREKSNEDKISLKILQTNLYEYCTNFCLIKCSNHCLLKDLSMSNNRIQIISKINKYCADDCCIRSVCSESCILYKYKNI